MFYGLIWAIAGRETAGMWCTDLQLITFDGFPLDARSRALRFAIHLVKLLLRWPGHPVGDCR